MTSAARRLYTRDGTMIVDVEDLVSWAVEHYTANMQTKSRRRSADDGRLVPDSTPESDSTNDLIQYGKSLCHGEMIAVRALGLVIVS